MVNLGHRIRQRRKQLQMSQQALAKDAWTRSYISQVELGKITPSTETLSAIARCLVTTVGELSGDEAVLRAAKATLFTPKVCQQYL